MTRVMLWLALTAVLVAEDQAPRVERAVVYGDLSLEAAVRAALPKRLGTASDELVSDVRKRVAAVPGVRQNDVSITCCDTRKTAILYIGVKRDDKAPRFRPEPDGPARLAPEGLALYEQASSKIMEGIMKGESAEDDDEGHALVRYLPARDLQKEAARRAASGRTLEWRQVALTAANANDRAAAAALMAYGPKDQALADALATAARDPNEEVRNNASRALGVLGSTRRSIRALRLDAGPALDLFQSVVWTDWNKASFALRALVETGDAGLLEQIRERDLSALRQIARWPAMHAYAAQVVLKQSNATPSHP